MTTQQKAARKAWKTRRANLQVVRSHRTSLGINNNNLSPAEKAWQTRRKNLQSVVVPQSLDLTTAHHAINSVKSLAEAKRMLRAIVDLTAGYVIKS